MEKRLKSLDELNEEGAHLAQSFAPRAGATLITLSGELGAGKTTLTQALARALGVTEAVTSPTFVLEKIYELPEGTSFRKLVHIDAYRLTSGSDLRALGFAGLMEDAGNLIILEWPERVADGLPTPALALTLKPEADGSRTMTYA